MCVYMCACKQVPHFFPAKKSTQSWVQMHLHVSVCMCIYLSVCVCVCKLNHNILTQPYTRMKTQHFGPYHRTIPVGSSYD